VPEVSLFTPELELQTLFVLDERGRIVSTREPTPSPGPKFCLIRGPTQCAWAVRADVPEARSSQLEELALAETPTVQFDSDPVHATRYISLVGGRVSSGPAFTFPEALPRVSDIVSVTEVAQLQHHFRGWKAEEISGCAPIVGIAEEGHPVSVCFCARRSDVAAEAGVETAEKFRGRGYAPRVAAAWAQAVRSSGRLPIYSTSWDNASSRAVARKLGLQPRASVWSLHE
jgi:RimJ/RimL family protein N-acetyltransferase